MINWFIDSHANIDCLIFVIWLTFLENLLGFNPSNLWLGNNLDRDSGDFCDSFCGKSRCCADCPQSPSPHVDFGCWPFWCWALLRQPGSSGQPQHASYWNVTRSSWQSCFAHFLRPGRSLWSRSGWKSRKTSRSVSVHSKIDGHRNDGPPCHRCDCLLLHCSLWSA